MNRLRVPKLICFHEFAWQTVTHPDGTVTEQPIPLPFARRQAFLAQLASMKLHLVRYGQDDELSMLERIKLLLIDGQTALDLRNQHKRSEQQWRDWHSTVARVSHTVTEMLGAYLHADDLELVLERASRGMMPSIKTAEERRLERREAKWRHGAAIATLRDAETAATRRARLAQDIDEELRGMGTCLAEQPQFLQHMGA